MRKETPSTARTVRRSRSSSASGPRAPVRGRTTLNVFCRFSTSTIATLPPFAYPSLADARISSLLQAGKGHSAPGTAVMAHTETPDAVRHEQQHHGDDWRQKAHEARRAERVALVQHVERGKVVHERQRHR